MTINELVPILILLFVFFILVYTLTTRILESLEYTSKLRAISEITKTMTEKGYRFDINDVQNVLKKEDRNAIERK